MEVIVSIQKDLTQGSLGPLIRQLAVPAGMGLFFHTMYNVVDTWYAGLLSTEALSALAISFPVFFMIIAVAVGMEVGSATLVSNALGAGKREQAQTYVFQAIGLGLLVSLALTLWGWFCSPCLFRLLGTKGGSLDKALDYMNIMFAGCVFFVLTDVVNAPLIASGDSRPMRNISFISFLTNIILNPALMFGWSIFPALGFRGIALATVLVQGAVLLYLTYYVRREGFLSIPSLRVFIPRAKIYGELIHQALPPMLNLFGMGVGFFIITWYVAGFGEKAVAAYGIAMRLEQIVTLLFVALEIAVLNIAGQNFGAGKIDRVRDAMKQCLKYSLYITMIGGGLLLCFRELTMQFFSSDSEVVFLGKQYLLIITFTLFAHATVLITTHTLQGMKKPMFAVWLMLFRQILGPLLIFYLLANYFNLGLWGIWWGIFGVNWVAAIFSYRCASKAIIAMV